ncbi:iron ABC transporter permease [Clostridium sporogenes]|uniref:TetR/AcrR family transcriptional regulator n=1 Tax=Clostridium sporogenes TaxID=1509 RepID=UPI00077FEBAD|nr:TetR/AcrR family transcriptional regulator [Clostridium sporogenes]KYN78921.1 iron ABC transporter permease [Clostridium sporogenes]MCW6089041.1 TetR/AcrR family transcriptional regulator [Clostridium sporogenes]SUY62500.1 TetR family transcriptional regulator [Clostridium sporogenes]
MAQWVEEATDNIITAAKEEFLKYGFIKASLRRIAKKAKTSPSSIYTRFNNKEDLFSYFVKEHSDYILSRTKNYMENFSSQKKEIQIDSRKNNAGAFTKTLVDYIYDHFDEFYLLICCSKGTIYENFIEELAKLETKYTKKYLLTIDSDIGNFPKVTEEFIHMMSRSFFHGFFEIVRQKFDKEKGREHIEKIILFYNGGWGKFLI